MHLLILWDAVTVPTVRFSWGFAGAVEGVQQQFATQTLRVHLLGIENSLLQRLPNCFSPTRWGFNVSFKITPAVRELVRQLRDKNCLAAIIGLATSRCRFCHRVLQGAPPRGRQLYFTPFIRSVKSTLSYLKSGVTRVRLADLNGPK